MTFPRLPLAPLAAALCLLPRPLPAADTNPPPKFDPPALYLTWQRDPATTMTIHWHTEGAAESLVQYRRSGTTNWADVTGLSRAASNSTRRVHTAELTGLQPKTVYVFRFGSDSKSFRFRTLPKDLTEPVRFIEGGDCYHDSKWMDPMNALAAKYDPAFVILGGDLAYSCNNNEEPEKMSRWNTFFASWKKHLVTADGRLIPMLVVIGNHEVRGFWKLPPERAAGFYSMFPAMPGPQGYNVLDFGRYLSVFLLDSGHTHPIEGAQSLWLEQELQKRSQTVPHILPIYHVQAYPASRPLLNDENGDISTKVRKFWCPIFEKHGIKAAFEHHDHVYKRTHPITDGKLDPNGVVYLGDGAWGVRLRASAPEGPRWYLAKHGAIRHFFLVTLYPEARHILSIDEHGSVFDELYQRVPPALVPK